MVLLFGDRMSTLLRQDERKSLGAFYTDEIVVRFLVRWGAHRGVQSAIDPSCGDGRFLREAGTAGIRRLVGCDLAPAALDEARSRLQAANIAAELILSDFFALQPREDLKVQLVLGNPPFIRYQRFNDASRRNALESCLKLGVRLSRLTSTWAPFLLHSLHFLHPGGHLAMVVPAEITRTNYGLEALRGLLKHFGRVHLLCFEQNFFDAAQTETCLLLCSDFGQSSGSVHLSPLETIHALADFPVDDAPVEHQVAFTTTRETSSRFGEAFLPAEPRRVLRSLQRHPQVRTVAAVADVANGYVTGDNAFFHRTEEAARRQDLPLTWLRPVLRNSRSIQGLVFDQTDVHALEEEGFAHHLVVPEQDLFSEPSQLDRFVEDGETRGTPLRFKCRSRSPWWKVPGVQGADVVVAYMMGDRPKAALNRSRYYFSNSLHGLRLKQGGEHAERLALAFCSSLTLLSLEIEGRSYGGGILKIEPRELDRVLIPWPDLEAAEIHAAVREVDELLRSSRYDAAVARADQLLLTEGLSVSARSLRALRQGRKRLKDRRSRRSPA
jgi:adenine-specific DNA-methyltransferase